MPNVTSEPLEIDGMLWRPKRGTTTTAEQFIAARTLWIELTTSPAARWNPWEAEDRKAELDQAQDVMQGWTRAEPGFRQMTGRQVDAWMKREDKNAQRRHAEQDRRRERDRARYDPQREKDRLALIEQQAILAYVTEELAGYRTGERFPAMASARRNDEIAELEQRAAAASGQIALLTPKVGDPETVVDERGWSLEDRRENALFRFRLDREHHVRQLRVTVAELTEQLREAADKTAKAEVRNKLANPADELKRLLAIPPLTTEDMCADCFTPLFLHGYMWSSANPCHPCAAWPLNREHLRKFREMFDSMVAANEARKPAKAMPPKPKPLAVIPSGLPIAEVMARLAEVQAEHPDAKVRRGNANKWEVWQGESST